MRRRRKRLAAQIAPPILTQLVRTPRPAVSIVTKAPTQAYQPAYSGTY